MSMSLEQFGSGVSVPLLWIDRCGDRRYGSVALSRSRVARCGSVAMGWSLWIGCYGLVVVDRSWWIGRCGSIALIRLRVGRYGLVAMGLCLWVGCCGSVAMGRSLCVCRCRSVAVGQSSWVDCYGSVAVGRSLWVGCFESVERRLLWVSLYISCYGSVAMSRLHVGCCGSRCASVAVGGSLCLAMGRLLRVGRCTSRSVAVI